MTSQYSVLGVYNLREPLTRAHIVQVTRDGESFPHFIAVESEAEARALLNDIEEGQLAAQSNDGLLSRCEALDAYASQLNSDRAADAKRLQEAEWREGALREELSRAQTEAAEAKSKSLQLSAELELARAAADAMAAQMRENSEIDSLLRELVKASTKDQYFKRNALAFAVRELGRLADSLRERLPSTSGSAMDDFSGFVSLVPISDVVESISAVAEKLQAEAIKGKF